MAPLRVCIYGGTDLEGPSTAFISSLACEILKSMDAVIVTGGFVRASGDPDAVSTDVAALRGARQFATESGVPLRDCYEAWLPEPSLDSRREDEGVERMTENEGITVRVVAGRTPLGRRLAMVAGVDLVVTISGKRHTEVVVEQALEVGVPVCPIPNANGDSETLLRKERRRVAAAFDGDVFEACLGEVNAWFLTEPARAAGAVVRLLKTAKVHKCLVLLPYDIEHNQLYNADIEPAVLEHMMPIRLDRIPKSEAIYTSFADAMQSATAVIADITQLNENVMYEIGYAHGRRMTPLIFTRNAGRFSDLPVYLRTLNVRLVTNEEPVRQLIDGYLRQQKGARRSPQFAASA